MRLAHYTVAATIVLVAACGTILDIQDAETDPLLLGGGNGGEVGTGGEGGDAPDELCAQYCQIAEAACTGDHDQWFTAELCELYCGFLPPGQPGDEIGNTVQCRLFQAETTQGIGEPELYCPRAGPGGDGVCGSNCQSYCTVLEQACPQKFAENHDSIVECVTDCDTLRDDGDYDITDTEGDSIQCRLYHLTAASKVPGEHCGHAVGDAPCRDSAGGAGGMGGAGGAGGAGGN